MRAIPGTVTEYGIDQRLQQERLVEHNDPQPKLPDPLNGSFVVGKPDINPGHTKLETAGDHTRNWRHRSDAEAWATLESKKTGKELTVYRLVPVHITATTPKPEVLHRIQCPIHGYQEAVIVPGVANDWTCVDCV